MMRLVQIDAPRAVVCAACMVISMAFGVESSSAQMLETEQRFEGDIPILRELQIPANEPSLFLSNEDLTHAPLSSTPEPTSAVLLSVAAAALLTRHRH